MSSERTKSTARHLVIVALVAGAAGLGWIAGQTLPDFKISRSTAKIAEPPELVEAEASLEEQVAAVKRGGSSTIQIVSRPLAGSDIVHIGELKNLQVLLLDHGQNAIGDDDCRLLAGLPDLVHLRIRGGAIGDAGLAHLAGLSQLKILNLPHSRATDEGLKSLAAMPRLRQLRLGSRQIGDEGMPELSSFPTLERLHLIDVPITDAGLAEIARLSKLQSLYLDGSLVTDAGLDRLFRTRPHLHVHINQQHHDRDPQRRHD